MYFAGFTEATLLETVSFVRKNLNLCSGGVNTAQMSHKEGCSDGIKHVLNIGYIYNWKKLYSSNYTLLGI